MDLTDVKVNKLGLQLEFELNTPLLNENAYVKSFEAKGDGITDDTIAIQNAINYAKNNNINKVFLINNATHIISNTLFIPSNITLDGNGNSTIKMINGSIKENMLKAGENDTEYTQASQGCNITINNITFDGNGPNRGDMSTPKSDYLFALYFSYVSNLKMTDCTIKNSVNDALTVYVCKNVFIKKCIIKDVVMTPVVVNPYFMANGITIYGGLGTLLGEATDNIIIDDCIIENIDDVGISVIGISGLSADPHDVTIRNCFIDTACSGIGLESGQGGGDDSQYRSKVISNNVMNCGRPKTTGEIEGVGIIVDDSCFFTIIDSNNVDNCKDGIAVRGNDTLIANNTIANPTYHTIVVTNHLFGTNKVCYRPIIKNNICIGKTSMISGINISCQDGIIESNSITNIFSNNVGYFGAGIYLQYPYNGVVIKNNLLNNLNYEAICLSSQVGYLSQNVYIEGNIAYVNNNYGVNVEGVTTITNVHICRNTFVNTALLITLSTLIYNPNNFNGSFNVEDNTLVGYVDCQSFIHQSAPTNGKWYRGQTITNTNVIFGTNPSIEKWVCKFTGVANNTVWVANTLYAKGKQVNANGHVYESTTSGTSGSIAPSHTSGSVTDGTISWIYIDEFASFVPCGIIGAIKLPTLPNSTASNIVALRNNFNSLLEILKSSGLMS